MMLKGEMILDLSGLKLSRWVFNLLIASMTPKHTLSSSKCSHNGIRFAMDALADGDR